MAESQENKPKTCPHFVGWDNNGAMCALCGKRFPSELDKAKKQIAELKQTIESLRNANRAYVETNKRLCDRLAKFKRKR